MRITKKGILLISSIVTLGFTSKVVFDHNNKVSANDDAQVIHNVKVTNFDEGLNNVKSNLPISFKNKVKMPKNLPFQLERITARKLDMNGNAFEQTFIGKKGEILTILVQDVPAEKDYSNNFGEKPVNVTLKDGNQAIFFKNHATVQLSWIAKDTGLQYTMILFRTKHVTDNELKNETNNSHIDTLEQTEESLTNIN